MNRLLIGLVAFLLLPALLPAGTFDNGGFENGTASGWTTGAGSWSTSPAFEWPPAPANYLPGGAKYDMSYWRGAVVTPGADPVVGAALNQVYNGSYAMRINNQYDDYDYSVGVISQTVANFSDKDIYFAWAAVLEASHGATDSDNFTLKLIDETLGSILYSASYSSFSAPGIFNTAGGWYYTTWQAEHIDTSASLGHTLTLQLLASDCALGGHAGYVYLDGFGAELPPETSGVPEPGTIGLMLFGLGGLAFAKFRKR
jgi:hypothetical protein